ncbi:unnamed protein product [Macrosiphum euphorbiae]|uniref:Zinc finger PHD-type domain-containing protein n=1 Tax=Macrosiphum euphorbiae TaxID=13131 RepID=A0AAV0VXT5_9HEMI|nr:unnamed protein product [Macrosiphum euphorbiae]
MSNCSKCKDTLIPEDEIVCSECDSKYHFTCGGLNTLSFQKLSKNTKNRWVCNVCKYKWDISKKNMDTKSTDFTFQDLANSVKFMSEKFDDFNGTVNKLLEEMKEIRKENTQLYENNKRLSQDIENLKYRLDSIEQNNLDSTIEIIGIPKVTNEKCIDTVIKLATILNIVITVEEAYRVPITINGEHKIIARLAKPGMTIAIIANCKQNKTLKLSNINPEWSDDIYKFIYKSTYH